MAVILGRRRIFEGQGIIGGEGRKVATLSITKDLGGGEVNSLPLEMALWLMIACNSDTQLTVGVR